MSKFIEKIKEFLKPQPTHLRVILLLLSGWVTSIALTFSFGAGITTFICLLAFSLFKEFVFSDHFDFPNIWAVVIGSILAMLFYVPVDYFML